MSSDELRWDEAASAAAAAAEREKNSMDFYWGTCKKVEHAAQQAERASNCASFCASCSAIYDALVLQDLGNF